MHRIKDVLWIFNSIVAMYCKYKQSQSANCNNRSLTSNILTPYAKWTLYISCRPNCHSHMTCTQYVATIYHSTLPTSGGLLVYSLNSFYVSSLIFQYYFVWCSNWVCHLTAVFYTLRRSGGWRDMHEKLVPLRHRFARQFKHLQPMDATSIWELAAHWACAH